MVSDSIMWKTLPYLLNMKEEKVIEETISARALASANMEICGGKTIC